ncbi:ERMES complex subunit [Blyttiomyces sp. JEL0837]|nr:ERMES complex subunit [Blyttiomyces sp. JEL0837]
MSFKVNWPEFSPHFLDKAKEQLAVALNKGEKPANIVDYIEVTELNMGTKPPDLEILEIGELAEERFRGIFRMVYSGDAYVVLHTKVQANPLNVPKYHYTIHKRHTGMLAANKPLVVPMHLRISNLKLRGIIVLVVDKTKGITLVFKSDPLERVDVNSTFDNIPNIRRFLQNQIEGQLRQMFQDDLPQLIHNLSLVYINRQEDGRSSPPSLAGAPSSGERSASHRKDRDLGDHLDSRSVDSGYMSEEMAQRFIERPHHQKWTGNEPVMSSDYGSDSEESMYSSMAGFVLTKSIGPKQPNIGLQKLLEEEAPPAVEPLVLNRMLLLSSRKSVDRISLRSPSGKSQAASSIGKWDSGASSKGPTQSEISSTSTEKPANTTQIRVSTASSDSGMRISTSGVDLRRLGSESGLPPRDYLHPSRTWGGSESTYRGTRSNTVSVDQRSEGNSEDNMSNYTAQSSPAPTAYRRFMYNHSSNSSRYGSSPVSSPVLGPRNDGNYFPSYNNGNNGGHLEQEEITDKVILQPSDNEVAAHLASLMHAHHTMAPLTHHLEHATFRTLPHHPPTNGGSASGVNLAAMAMSGQSISASWNGSPSNNGPSASGNRKRTITRTVRKLKLPNGVSVPGLSPSPSTANLFNYGSSDNGGSSRASSVRAASVRGDSISPVVERNEECLTPPAAKSVASSGRSSAMSSATIRPLQRSEPPTPTDIK